MAGSGGLRRLIDSSIELEISLAEDRWIGFLQQGQIFIIFLLQFRQKKELSPPTTAAVE